MEEPQSISNKSRIVPELRSSRLVLRGFRPSDTDLFLDQMVCEPPFAGDPVNARPQAWRILSMVVGGWFLEGCGYWVIEELSTKRPIGRVGAFAPRGWPDFEVGWEVFPEYRKHGYATEATVAAAIWLRDVLGIDTMTHVIPATNVASQKLAVCIGAVQVREQALPDGNVAGTWITRWPAFAQSQGFRRYAHA